MNPTQVRELGLTPKFCLEDLKRDPDRTLASIASDLSRFMEPAGVSVGYINIVNLDPKSEDYNPDGMIGRFQIRQFR